MSDKGKFNRQETITGAPNDLFCKICSEKQILPRNSITLGTAKKIKMINHSCTILEGYLINSL